MKYLAFCPALLFLSLGASQSAVAQGSPDVSVTQFVSALNSHDFRKAASMVDGASSDTDFSPYQKVMAELPKLVVAIQKSSRTGNTAWVQYRVTQFNRARTESVALRTVERQWKIVPDKLTSSLGEFAYALSHPEMIVKARAAAKATSALSNVKQLALGCMLYLGDNDDKFSLSSTNAQAKLAPYLKNPALWTSPDDPKGTRSFSVNDLMTGRRLETVREPAKTVLVYEGRGNKPKFRYDGRAVIGYADGHAKLVSQADASKLVWKP